VLAERATQQKPAKIRLPGLTGVSSRARAGQGVGELSVQGFVDDGTGRARFDSVAGYGFHLLLTAALLPELERSGRRRRCGRAGSQWSAWPANPASTAPSSM